MLRKSLVVIAVLMLGVTAAAAQSCQDKITARQDLMKKSGAAAKTGASMVKGEIPYDQDKAKEIFTAFTNDANAMPTLFPECSKEGEKTTAAPSIWEKPDDFKAAMAKFGADVKAGQENTKDLDTFKTNFQAIGKDCGGCHQTFRVRPS